MWFLAPEGFLLRWVCHPFPSPPLPTTGLSSAPGFPLYYLHPLYLTGGSESCAVAPKRRKVRTKKTASALFRLTQPPTSPLSVLIRGSDLTWRSSPSCQDLAATVPHPPVWCSAKLALSLPGWGLCLSPLCTVLPHTCKQALVSNVLRNPWSAEHFVNLLLSLRSPK